MNARELISRLLHGARQVEERIKERRTHTLHTEADYKDELAENYDDVGLHRRAGELREEAAELRLQAEYDLITGDGSSNGSDHDA